MTLKSSVSSVETKTGRCFDVTMVLRHRREILHVKINELYKKTLKFYDNSSQFSFSLASDISHFGANPHTHEAGVEAAAP